jgi:hypothetical protein
VDSKQLCGFANAALRAAVEHLLHEAVELLAHDVLLQVPAGQQMKGLDVLLTRALDHIARQ